MVKHLKLNIKNTQIAEAINLGNLKSKLAKKKIDVADSEESAIPQKSEPEKPHKIEAEEALKEESPRIRARSKSAFAEGVPVEHKAAPEESEGIEEATFAPEPQKSSEEIRLAVFGEEAIAIEETHQEVETSPPMSKSMPAEDSVKAKVEPKKTGSFSTKERKAPTLLSLPKARTHHEFASETHPPKVKLGPTGRHIKDLLPPKPQPKHYAPPQTIRPSAEKATEKVAAVSEEAKLKAKAKGTSESEEEKIKKGPHAPKFKEFRDIKPAKKQTTERTFDARDRHGLRLPEDEHWRKRRAAKIKMTQEDTTIRPTSLKIRLPISLKDLASEMKLKASQLISKLFLQGAAATLNDVLDDETVIQLLGHDFGCTITIDTSEEERIQITDKTIKEEIDSANPSLLTIRAPVAAFMGHVDHGKTSLIDAIRKTNRAAGEAGAITQHIGAFRCSTSIGDITILDTPGHEAFSAMRARGADVTDIVVLVVAGDEGIRQQTLEAIQHAKAANVTIVVALNKCDKPNFNADNVYRQLAEHELLPEVWGGQTLTVNCSAVTGEGLQQLLEMLALQAEILELKASPMSRARGTVLESEMHKGMGAVATILVQNGTLRLGDSLVFEQHWARVKTMRDEFGTQLQEAGPSTPVEITGLSALPEAGQEFIAVKNEKEAREIAEARMRDVRYTVLQQKKKLSMEKFLQQKPEEVTKKSLNIILRVDVQGSLEALKAALLKIVSTKAEINIINAAVGEISESDVQLAAASKAVIFGFHTQIESHSEALLKQLGVQVRLHDVIYHAVDDAKKMLAALLDKIAIETEKGKAEVKATFKSSVYGIIAGCIVAEGTINRSNHMRVNRKGEIIWKGTVSSLKRVKEDVREVQKGLECGIVLNGFSDFQEGDILEAYEVTYIVQEL